MNIPSSSRRRALAIIDVQQEFVSTGGSTTVANIRRLIGSVSYHLYIEAVFDAGRGSIWDLQTGWSTPNSARPDTLEVVAAALKGRPVIPVRKHTKSVFSGIPNLAVVLRKHKIQELHLVGFDINDCVMASAFDSFDNGLFTYVIEECCGASLGTELWGPAVALLRYLNMTNNSLHEALPVILV